MDLLDREKLIRTSDLDQADWNYSGLLGMVIRQRLGLARTLLTDLPPGDLVEIGYGSGMFMPTLRRYATWLGGVDVHPHAREVTGVLAREGITADLRQGTVESLPLEGASVDTLVAISSLEFVDDLEAAAAQMHRVLRPGGSLVVVTPGHNRMLDLGLRLLTGERAEDTFQGRRQLVQPTLARWFTLERRLRFPPVGPRFYTALRLRRSGRAATQVTRSSRK